MTTQKLQPTTAATALPRYQIDTAEPAAVRPIEAPKWVLDAAHSVVEFRVKHLMVATVTGRFHAVRGTLAFDAAHPAASSVVAEIDAASIDTGQEQRDGHLRSADFFDAEKYPTLSFESTAVEPTGEGEARITGNLTMHGVTKPVVLEATFEGRIKDPWGKDRVAFSAETTINRKDFGLNWNQVLETGGVMVSDKVKVALHLAFTAE